MKAEHHPLVLDHHPHRHCRAVSAPGTTGRCMRESSATTLGCTSPRSAPVFSPPRWGPVGAFRCSMRASCFLSPPLLTTRNALNGSWRHSAAEGRCVVKEECAHSTLTTHRCIHLSSLLWAMLDLCQSQFARLLALCTDPPHSPLTSHSPPCISGRLLASSADLSLPALLQKSAGLSRERAFPSSRLQLLFAGNHLMHSISGCIQECWADRNTSTTSTKLRSRTVEPCMLSISYRDDNKQQPLRDSPSSHSAPHVLPLPCTSAA